MIDTNQTFGYRQPLAILECSNFGFDILSGKIKLLNHWALTKFNRTKRSLCRTATFLLPIIILY